MHEEDREALSGNPVSANQQEFELSRQSAEVSNSEQEDNSSLQNEVLQQAPSPEQLGDGDDGENHTKIDSPQRTPAATASSYRDIIAERLARAAEKRGSSSADHGPTRAMAHSSEASIKENVDPPNFSGQNAKREEVENSDAVTDTEKASGPDLFDTGAERATSSSMTGRERALQRQRERAELRSGGRRPAFVEEIQSANTGPENSGSELPSDIVSPSVTEPLANLTLRKRSEIVESASENEEEKTETEAKEIGKSSYVSNVENGDRPDFSARDSRFAERRERRSDRPERSERPERGERPDRTERPDRPVREERRPREERPAREERLAGVERTPREERPRPISGDLRSAGSEPRRLDAAISTGNAATMRRQEPENARRESMSENVLDQLKGGTPQHSERAFELAKSFATKVGVSVVIPLYNEQESLRELTAALRTQLMRLAAGKYEIIYVNDGSTDRSGEILKDILGGSSRVTVLTFRRNMGKSAGLAAGFAEAKYGVVITMDADLQDDPRELPNLIAKLAEGYDLVSGWKKKRYDPITKTGPSRFFNSVTSFFAGIQLHDFNCGLKAYRKEVTDKLDVYGEMHRYLPALAHWRGFKVGEIPVVHHPRKFGKSKFGSSRFFKGFLDLLSIVFTNRYGTRPLHLFGTVGTLLAIVGGAIDLWVSVEWMMGLTILSNRPILLLGILLILVGVQLISLGLLGEMIVKNMSSRADISVLREKGHRSAELRDRMLSRERRVGRRSVPGSVEAGSERRFRPEGRTGAEGRTGRRERTNTEGSTTSESRGNQDGRTGPDGRRRIRRTPRA